MGRKKSVDPERINYENIMALMDGETVGRNKAAEWVGGLTRLLQLVEEGKIEAVKDSDKQNAKWRCNARQVLLHCRNMRQNI